MNDIEAGVLLAKVSALDPYAPAEDKNVLDAWAATLYDVPADFAEQVVINHYRSTRETIAPADICGAWRKFRRAQLDRQILEGEKRGANRGRLALESGQTRAGLALAQEAITAAKVARDARRTAALAHRCPHCNAEPGTSCYVRTGSGFRRPAANIHSARNALVTNRASLAP